MTLSMTLAILAFLAWGFVQVFRWTFSDNSHQTHFKGPYGYDDKDDEDK